MVLFPFTAFRLSIETLPIVNLKSWVDFHSPLLGSAAMTDESGSSPLPFPVQEQVVSILPWFAMEALTAAKVALMPAIAVSARSTNS